MAGDGEEEGGRVGHLGSREKREGRKKVEGKKDRGNKGKEESGGR